MVRPMRREIRPEEKKSSSPLRRTKTTTKTTTNQKKKKNDIRQIALQLEIYPFGIRLASLAFATEQ